MIELDLYNVLLNITTNKMYKTIIYNCSFISFNSLGFLEDVAVISN